METKYLIYKRIMAEPCYQARQGDALKLAEDIMLIVWLNNKKEEYDRNIKS